MKDYEIIEKENNEYLNIFKEDLISKGYNKETIEDHFWHVDAYLNRFLMIGIPTRMNKGCSYDVVNFIKDFVNEKVIPASKNNVKLFSISIRKFYKCMLENGLVEKENYDDLVWALKECNDEMIDDFYFKNPETIDLEKVTDCIESAGDIETYYLHKYRGEILSVLNDDALMDEEEKQEIYDKLDRYDDWIEIPGQYELHEYSIMEAFAKSLTNKEHSNKLLYVLNGKKPFRRFKDEINYIGISNSYYNYRHEKAKEIAVKWLQDNDVEYK